MKISVYDPFISKDIVENLGYEYVSTFKEGIKNADIISLHIPMTEKTKGLFNAEIIALMKDNSIIINCARGGIIDEKALKDALADGKLYGAGLDVFSIEPPNPDLEIFHAQNITVSPHNASLTEEAVISVHQMCANSVVAVLDGKVWDMVADKKVYDHQKWRNK